MNFRKIFFLKKTNFKIESLKYVPKIKNNKKLIESAFFLWHSVTEGA